MHDFRQWWDTVWAQAVHDQQLLGTNAFEVNRAKQHAESALHATTVAHTANAIESFTHRRRRLVMRNDQQGIGQPTRHRSGSPQDA